MICGMIKKRVKCAYGNINVPVTVKNWPVFGAESLLRYYLEQELHKKSCAAVQNQGILIGLQTFVREIRQLIELVWSFNGPWTLSRKCVVLRVSFHFGTRVPLLCIFF